MNTALKARPNVLKKDADSRWYSIPEAELDAFTQIVETIQNAEFMSTEWYEANDELSQQYGSYLKGDL